MRVSFCAIFNIQVALIRLSVDERCMLMPAAFSIISLFRAMLMIHSNSSAIRINVHKLLLLQRRRRQRRRRRCDMQIKQLFL